MSSTRLLKNTLTLYMRLIISMAVSFYTARVVLSVLGVSDFGVYNVVGGVITFLGFVNSAMATGTQRFLSYEMGLNTHTELNKVFSMAINIHVLIACVVFVMAETLGIWFLNNKMIIPEDRIYAANVVFQFTVFASMLTLTQAPYSAAIIAHERISVYALFDMGQAMLRLLGAVILVHISFDKLILHSFIILIITVIASLLIRIYCKKAFSECTYHKVTDFNLFRKMAGFAGWNLFGGLSVTMNNQGQGILLNLFFGPVVNAAQSIALQLNSSGSVLATNFQVAANPQIVKTSASGEQEEFRIMVERTSKFSFLLMLFLIGPLLLESEWLLIFWLKEVPPYAVTMCQITLFSTLINSLSLSLATAAQASGRIKLFQLVVGGLTLMNIPIAYLFLWVGFGPFSAFWVALSVVFISLWVRLILLQKITSIRFVSFLWNAIVPALVVAVICISIGSFAKVMLGKMQYSSLGVISITIISIICTTYILGLNNDERNYAKKLFSTFFHRFSLKN